MKIRKAKLKDVDHIALMEHLCFNENAFSRRSVIYHIKNNMVFCAYDDDRIVGYIVLSYLTTTNKRRIYSIGVDPDYRGKQIAYNMMLVVEDKCDACEIILEVDETNTPAIKLYEKLGYRVFGRYDMYYGKTDALKMKKSI